MNKGELGRWGVTSHFGRRLGGVVFHSVGRTLGNPSVVLQGECRQLDNLSPLERTLVSTDTDAGPVGTGHSVGPRVAILNEGTDEFVDQVRVGTTMATPLNERKVVCVLNRLRELTNRFRQ